MLNDARMFWRFARGLPPYFADVLTPERCHSILRDALERRGENFIAVLEQGVYGCPGSPYLPLLQRADVGLEDLKAEVRERGVEGTLERLWQAGVRVSIDEFKGRQPIVRDGLELEVCAADFNHPLVTQHLELYAGGTTGRPSRLAVDLGLLRYEAAATRLFFEAHELLQRPVATWRPAPPGAAALKIALRGAKFGVPLEAWFSHHPVRWNREGWKSAALLQTALWCGRRRGAIPRPVLAPIDQPAIVSNWLAARVSEGRPAVISCPPTNAVILASDCLDRGLDINGTLFWTGGEPHTEAKEQVLREAGATSATIWSITECGNLAMGCGRRNELDEVHLLEGKAATILAPVSTATGATIDAVHVTTLLPSTPKLMLNVDVGDCAILAERNCGCDFDSAGYHRHLHTIRSYEKLNAAGMHFLGTDVLTLVEQVLPAAHGGTPSDYQLSQEDDETGHTRVTLRASPELGELDPACVRETVLSFLAAKSRGERMMAEQWRQGETLRVRRQRPRATVSGKVPPIFFAN